MSDFTTENPDGMGEKCFDIMLFIVCFDIMLFIYSQVLKSGCACSFPPSNKVGCGVISVLYD